MEERRMENKPQLNKPTVLQQNNAPTEINLPGDHNTLIAHADNVKNEYRPTILITNPMPGMQQGYAIAVTLNLDFYNLIVVAGDVLDGTNHVMVDKERAITESTSDELKKQYAALTPEAIAEIKTFPTIIATENHSYGKIMEGNSPEEVYQNLMEALSDDDYRKAAIEKSYQRLTENFTWEIVSGKVRKIADTLCQSHQ